MCSERRESRTALYDVPQMVYAACGDAGVKVNRTAPELMKLVSDEAGDAIPVDGGWMRSV